jgi:hypothetical protein
MQNATNRASMNWYVLPSGWKYALLTQVYHDQYVQVRGTYGDANVYNGTSTSRPAM